MVFENPEKPSVQPWKRLWIKRDKKTTNSDLSGLCTIYPLFINHPHQLRSTLSKEAISVVISFPVLRNCAILRHA